MVCLSFQTFANSGRWPVLLLLLVALVYSSASFLFRFSLGSWKNCTWTSMKRIKKRWAFTDDCCRMTCKVTDLFAANRMPVLLLLKTRSMDQESLWGKQCVNVLWFFRASSLKPHECPAFFFGLPATSRSFTDSLRPICPEPQRRCHLFTNSLWNYELLIILAKTIERIWSQNHTVPVAVTCILSTVQNLG